MKYIKYIRAFTLIEMAVVLIILGLLAVLAYPGIFAQIERHRGQEALSTMNLIKSGLETCGIQNAYNFSLCQDASGTVWDSIGMANPSGTNFTYTTPTLTAPASSSVQGTYQIVATRNGSGATITITRGSDGVATCTGSGAFLGFC